MFKEKVLPLLTRRVLIPFLSLVAILLSLTVTLSLSKTTQSFIKKAAEQAPAMINDTYPLSAEATIIGLKINGQVTLINDGSFLRFILVAKDQSEYLVSEFSPLLSDNTTIAMSDSCDETCLLKPIIPDYLRIEGSEATYKIDKVKLETEPGQKLSSSAETDKEIAAVKKEKDNLKIQKINQQIKAKGMSWLAGETSVSKMTYAEKKKLFSKPDGSPADTLPNLQGFEYYKGGIFKIKSENDKQVLGDTTPSTLPPSWDWRNVNGENWNTSVKDQGAAGTCWAFADIGALESQINLYYNQHLDVNLSEQMLVDCINGEQAPLSTNSFRYPDCQNTCNSSSGNYCVISIRGMSDEHCDPYAQRDITYPSTTCNLNNICTDWQNRTWKNKDFFTYSPEPGIRSDCRNLSFYLTEDQLKRLLIAKGPLDSGIVSWSHAMVLVGYQNGSDWKVIEHCKSGDFCGLGDNGCSSNSCSQEGIEITKCINDFYFYGEVYSAKYTYQCQNWYGTKQWTYKKTESCPYGTICINNQCQNNNLFQLSPGYKTCSTRPLGDYYFWEYSEYSPGQGEPYWIFKNSWGTGWGENGYARINLSLANILRATLPLGPFTPPTDHSYWPAGFNNQIKCVDKDADRYCNWGISETKPSTCPAGCLPQKDCNDSDPLLGPFDSNLNCLCNPFAPSSLDKNQTVAGSSSLVAYNSWDTTGPSLIFSPLQKGTLDKIELLGSGDLGATLAVKIVDLSNNQNITETKYYKLLTVVSWRQWFTVDFSTEPNLDPAKQYRISFARTTGTLKFYLHRKTGSFDWAFKTYLRPCTGTPPTATPTPACPYNLSFIGLPQTAAEGNRLTIYTQSDTPLNNPTIEILTVSGQLVQKLNPAGAPIQASGRYNQQFEQTISLPVGSLTFVLKVNNVACESRQLTVTGLTPTPTPFPITTPTRTLTPTSVPTLTPTPRLTGTPTPTPSANNPPVIISSGSFPAGYAGKSYVGYVAEGYDVNTNDYLTMKVQGLPPGITAFNCPQQIIAGKRTIKCAVSGTPAAGSNRTYYGNMILTDGQGGSTTRSFTFVINP